LKGLTVTGTDRRGKHMWLTFDQPGHLYLHFGMTGSLRALKPEDEPPSHEKLVLTFDDSTRLLYRNLRRIGKVRWLEDATAVPPVSKLGPDPVLDAAFTPEWLEERLGRKKTTLKGALLDQTLFAGVGNWIADEILYQCGLNPSIRCNELDSKTIRHLHRTLKRILHKAIAVSADSSRFPRTWLFHHRWGKKAETDAQGNPIRFDTIGGRTTAWVPSRQS
jgi:formamidopyrimidine-DNA glycosylase